MAGMAELRLRQDNALDAIIWVRLHLHYEEALAASGGHPLSTNRAYGADLLRRCQQRVGQMDAVSEQIDVDVAGFIALHDARIRQAWIDHQARRGTGGLDAIPKLPPGMRERDFGSNPQRLSAPGRAYYLIAVNPQGRVEQRYVVDSLPDQRFALALRRHVGQLRLPPVGDAAPLRWMLAPMEFDDRSILLK